MSMEIFNMKLHTIHTGNFKLDGGAMFGVVPKQIWNSLNPSDDKNLCNWAMRCLLIQSGNRNILIDTGIGSKQSERFFSHYDLNGNQSLYSSLLKVGVGFEDITDVILTHLHFDHCGGAVKDQEGIGVPSFPNAVYYTTEEHLNHALHPNPREKASFLVENFKPLIDANRFTYLKKGDWISDFIEIEIGYGHTTAMILPIIHLPDGKKILYGADLFPSSAHIKPHFVMSYDIHPLITMEERQRFNEWAVEQDAWYFYEHDLQIEVSRVQKNDKGQFEPRDMKTLEALLYS